MGKQRALAPPSTCLWLRRGNLLRRGLVLPRFEFLNFLFLFFSFSRGLLPPFSLAFQQLHSGLGAGATVLASFRFFNIDSGVFVSVGDAQMRRTSHSGASIGQCTSPTPLVLASKISWGYLAIVRLMRH